MEAILHIEMEMPNTCNECTFEDFSSSPTPMCAIVRKQAHCNSRPSYCPLKPKNSVEKHECSFTDAYIC